MVVRLSATPIDPLVELDKYQSTIHARAGKFGATAIFIGTMRDFNEGDAVTKMTLDHYPGMTERNLQQIAEHAIDHWQLIDTLIVHRVGEIAPNDPIVLVAVWSTHRGAAFDACREIMEDLKSKAPFWKKEALKDQIRWVETNTDGY